MKVEHITLGGNAVIRDTICISDAVKNKLQYQEDRKDERTKLQATQQSSILEQRKKDLPAKNFESTNDNLGDFDLEAFEPH